MNIKLKTRALTTAVALGFAAIIGISGPAKAVQLDFVDFIDNTAGEQGVVGTFTLGGFTITAHGFNATVGTGSFTTGPYAYFDSGAAGIGVCQTLVATQCNPPNDDNVTGNNPLEILSISFDKAVTISNVLFRNDGHTPVFGTGKFIDVAIGTGVFATKTLIDGVVATALGAGLVGSPSFVLAAGEALNFKFNNQQFYLSALNVSAVPLPPALLLFGSALAGMGFLSRRRKKKEIMTA